VSFSNCRRASFACYTSVPVRVPRLIIKQRTIDAVLRRTLRRMVSRCNFRPWERFVRRQKTEVRRQKSDVRKQKSDVR